MHSPDERVSIREENYTEYKLGKYYMIETEYSKYFIPIEGLYYEN
jgi:hypothetical protein